MMATLAFNESTGDSGTGPDYEISVTSQRSFNTVE